MNVLENKVTVLTPTYNRAQLLKELYRSLCAQSNKKFQWLIIDDGSTDDTRLVVEEFLKENKMDIDYEYKENGGKHTALNFSHPYIEGKYLVIVDSDDYLVKDAIDIILKKWEKYSSNKNVVGITFQKGGKRDFKPFDVGLYGEYVSNFVKETNLGMKGDHCETILSDAFCGFEFPVFEDERFIAEGAMWFETTKNKEVVYCDEVIYLAEYLDDGLTNSGRKLHIKNPKGCKWHASVFLGKCFNWKIRFKNALLFICYSKFLHEKDKEILDEEKQYKSLISFSLLPGKLLYHYWKKKYS